MGALKKYGRKLVGTVGGFLVGGPIGAAAGFTAASYQDKKFDDRRIAADEREASAAARQAAHDAEVAQLAKNALSTVSLRKRRGSYATRLTGTPTMGSSPGSSGSTMLGQ